MRVALRAAIVDGQLVRAGDQVVAMLDAPNYDAAVFASPDVLDIKRDARRLIAFGAGAHYCLGAALARVEARSHSLR